MVIKKSYTPKRDTRLILEVISVMKQYFVRINGSSAELHLILKRIWFIYLLYIYRMTIFYIRYATFILWFCVRGDWRVNMVIFMHRRNEEHCSWRKRNANRYLWQLLGTEGNRWQDSRKVSDCILTKRFRIERFTASQKSTSKNNNNT